MADCGWIAGDSVKMSFTSEFAGLTAEMMAVAGLLLVVIEMGVLALRIVARLGGFKV